MDAKKFYLLVIVVLAHLVTNTALAAPPPQGYTKVSDDFAINLTTNHVLILIKRTDTWNALDVSTLTQRAPTDLRTQNLLQQYNQNVVPRLQQQQAFAAQGTGVTPVQSRFFVNGDGTIQMHLKSGRTVAYQNTAHWLHSPQDPSQHELRDQFGSFLGQSMSGILGFNGFFPSQSRFGIDRSGTVLITLDGSNWLYMNHVPVGLEVEYGNFLQEAYNHYLDGLLYGAAQMAVSLPQQLALTNPSQYGCSVQSQPFISLSSRAPSSTVYMYNYPYFHRNPGTGLLQLPQDRSVLMHWNANSASDHKPVVARVKPYGAIELKTGTYNMLNEGFIGLVSNQGLTPAMFGNRQQKNMAQIQKMIDSGLDVIALQEVSDADRDAIQQVIVSPSNQHMALQCVQSASPPHGGAGDNGCFLINTHKFSAVHTAPLSAGQLSVANPIGNFGGKKYIQELVLTPMPDGSGQHLQPIRFVNAHVEFQKVGDFNAQMQRLHSMPTVVMGDMNEDDHRQFTSVNIPQPTHYTALGTNSEANQLKSLDHIGTMGAFQGFGYDPTLTDKVREP